MYIESDVVHCRRLAAAAVVRRRLTTRDGHAVKRHPRGHGERAVATRDTIYICGQLRRSLRLSRCPQICTGQRRPRARRFPVRSRKTSADAARGHRVCSVHWTRSRHTTSTRTRTGLRRTQGSLSTTAKTLRPDISVSLMGRMRGSPGYGFPAASFVRSTA